MSDVQTAVGTLEKKGVKETKELALFIGALGSAFSKAKDDGKITLDDAMLLVPLLGLAKEAIQDADQVVAELKDLDDDEKKEIIEEFKSAFDLKDDRLEEQVVLSIEIGLKLVQLVNSFS